MTNYELISVKDIDRIDRNALVRRLQELGWKSLAKRGGMRDPEGRLYLVPESLESGLDYEAIRAVLQALLATEHVLSLKDLLREKE